MSGGPEAGGSSAREPAAGDGPAGRSGRAWVVLLAVTGAGLASDLWSKAAAFASVAGEPVVLRRADVLAGGPLGELIPRHEPVSVVPGLLEFVLVLNPGAVFGVGAGKRWLFVTFTVAAVAFAVWLFTSWTRRRDWFAHAGIGLLLAGGLGNLYDRLVFGCVRDFIHPLPGVRMPFGLPGPGPGGEVWPYVSNVADLWLILGIAALLIHGWRREPEGAEDAAEPEGSRVEREPGGGDAESSRRSGSASA